MLEGLNDYIVIKMTDDFPNYTHFDDLDIICKDAEILAKNLLAHNTPSGVDRILVSQTGTGHIHLDYYIPTHNNLNLRFDLIDSFSYTKFQVNGEYMDLVLDRKGIKVIDEKKVYIPRRVDDLVIRFLEWVEYPAKKKHQRYVKENLDSDMMDEFVSIILKNTTLIKEHMRDIIV